MLRRYITATVMLLSLAACLNNDASYPIPPDWKEVYVYQYMPSWYQEKHPCIFLPVPMEEEINDEPGGMYSGPNLNFSFEYVDEKKIDELCTAKDTDLIYRKGKNSVQEVALTCAPPAEHIKLMYKFNVENYEFFVSPSWLSTPEQTQMVLISLLNARIEK